MLPKIDELRESKISNPLVIGSITETKEDNLISDSEICVDGYCAIRRGWNRKGEDVVCYVTNKILLQR